MPLHDLCFVLRVRPLSLPDLFVCVSLSLYEQVEMILRLEVNNALILMNNNE